MKESQGEPKVAWKGRDQDPERNLPLASSSFSEPSGGTDNDPMQKMT